MESTTGRVPYPVNFGIVFFPLVLKGAIELPLLLDLDNRVSRRWNIYVYPSSYLVDRQGIIRYAYLGALEWDSAENIRIIRDLLQQN